MFWNKWKEQKKKYKELDKKYIKLKKRNEDLEERMQEMEEILKKPVGAPYTLWKGKEVSPEKVAIFYGNTK